ncbi:cysteine proteinase inhibitor B-like [Magnolia sinica]|uniref:cysteine proteinase inhibitor B-like n=1 Tax=Magnolia sinica TaxID=86752 RepID=UPI002657EBA5|nr:cysteine proteinase inhibitor B-like [Magnolia sinica]
MAASPLLLCLLLLIFFTSNAFSSPTQLGGRKDGKLGGREEITDVKSNQEVQTLGKFCVQEFNKTSRRGPIAFSQVVKAEKQVVSGIKYYLTIEAAEGGVKRTFDAVVVVKEWLHSKELLSFVPKSR